MPGGSVRYLLIFFASSEFLCTGTEVKNHTAPHRADALAASRPRPLEPCPFPGAHGRLAPAIFPRRKPGVDAGMHKSPPVVVTPELLVTLHNLPLNQAAEAIGVSATAFKKACRKLGISRWAYKRGTAKTEHERGVRKAAAAAAISAWPCRMPDRRPAAPPPHPPHPPHAAYYHTPPPAAAPPARPAEAPADDTPRPPPAAAAAPGWRSVFADCAAALDADCGGGQGGGGGDCGDASGLLFGWGAAAVAVPSDPGSPLYDDWIASPPRAPPPPGLAGLGGDEGGGGDGGGGGDDGDDCAISDGFLLEEPDDGLDHDFRLRRA
jgi:hypothetical protein